MDTGSTTGSFAVGRASCEEGVKPSERSRSTSSTYDVDASERYYFDLPLPPDKMLVAGTYEMHFRVAGHPTTDMPVDATIDVDSGSTTVNGSNTTITAGASEATITSEITVSSDIPITSSLSVYVTCPSGTAHVVLRSIHDECVFGVQASASGCPRTTPMLTLTSPSQGSHNNPTSLDDYPDFEVTAEYVYPADSMRITSYTDTTPSSAHSTSGASTQTVDTAENQTSSFPLESRRLFSTMTATKFPDALQNTYYVIAAHETGSSTDMATVAFHGYLDAERPSLTTLNGTSGSSYITTDTTPIATWTNPNESSDRWQVVVTKVSDGSTEHDSTETVSVANSYTLPDTLTTDTQLKVVVTVADGTDWSADSLPGYFEIDSTGTSLKITSHNGTKDGPEIITSQAPTVEWAFAKTQSAYNVSAIDTSNDTIVYESGWVASATESKALPASTLSLGVTYALQVQTKDAQGNIYGADEQQYVHVNESSISAPSLTAEPDTDRETDVTLEWSAPTVNDGDTLTYDVELTASTAETVVTYGDVSGVSLYLGRLPADTYSWRVRAVDEHDLDGTWSASDSFDVALTGNLPVATLVPLVTTTDTTPRTTWGYYDADDEPQDAYEVEVDDTDDTFASLVEDSGTVVSTDTYYQHGTLSVGTYYRRVRVRSNSVDWSSWVNDSFEITSGTSQADTVALYRSAGGVLIDPADYPSSGVEIRRRLSAPLELSFKVNNFDGLTANIADDDEIVCYVKDEDGQRLEFRGYVADKGVGQFAEIVCLDISHQFQRLAVTRTLQGVSLAEVIETIVEQPQTDVSTGIVAHVEEMHDPDTAGRPINMAAFDGQGKYVSDWLSEFARDTGCEWYMESVSGTWHFHWFNPANVSSWKTIKDDIDFSAENASTARAVDPPDITRSRRERVTRVRYWSSPHPVLPYGHRSFDSFMSESVDNWTAYSGLTVATDASNTTKGSNSIHFQYSVTGAESVGPFIRLGYFKLPSTWRDLTVQEFGDLVFQAKVAYSGTSSWASDPNDAVIALRACSGASVGPLTNSSSSRSGEVVLTGTDWIDHRIFLPTNSWGTGYDPTDVNVLVLDLAVGRGVEIATGETFTIDLYLDNMLIVGDPPTPQGFQYYVETAAVTAGTELPLEYQLSSKGLPKDAATQLAKARLNKMSNTQIGVSDVKLYGVRNIPTQRKVPLTLNEAGLTGVTYGITSITWKPYEDVTVLSLGDRVVADRDQAITGAFDATRERLRALDMERQT